MHATAPAGQVAGPPTSKHSAMRRAPGLVLALGLLGGAAVAAPASAAPPSVQAEAESEVVWLCRPGLADDPCEVPLDTTVREIDGSERAETPARPAQDQRPVDCFYVYPTVSNQLTPNADKSRDPELESIAKYQAAPFSTQCRVFAPIYRQATLASIGTAQAQDQATLRETAYADVVAAWNDYLARDNQGRGVVLVGHSQGTRMLRALIKREIDDRPEVRKLLVGATLLGGNVTVREGQTVGGDFQQVPICTQQGEVGCVVAFSTYAEDPPEDSRFGRTTPDETFGFPGGEGFQAACTDPGALSGMTDPVGVTVPTEPYAPGPIAAGIVITNGGPPPSAETTWVRPRDRYQGSCQTINGAHVLRYDPVGDSRRPNPFPDPTWGTHLIDVNYGLERQVAIVAAQTQGWLAQNAAAPAVAAPPAAAPQAQAATPAAAQQRTLASTGASDLLPVLAGVTVGASVLARRRR